MNKFGFNVGDIVRIEGDPASKYYGQVGMVYKIREDGWVGIDLRDGTYIERFEEDLQLLPPEEYGKSASKVKGERVMLYEDFVEQFGRPKVGDEVILSIKEGKKYRVIGMYDDKVYLEEQGGDWFRETWHGKYNREEKCHEVGDNSDYWNKKASKKREAGTWELPNTVDKARELASIIEDIKSKNLNFKEFYERLTNVFGDDELYDELDEIEQSALKETISVIKKYVKRFLKDYEDYPESFNVKFSKEAIEILKNL